jgi:glycosyltransferase involved in cell wall biosynthesis
MPQPRLGFFQEKEDACNPFLLQSRGRLGTVTSPPAEDVHVWGLLLPVCCRGSPDEECFSRLSSFVQSIEATLELAQRAQLMIFLGIDQFDVFYDRDDTKARVIDLFTAIGVPRPSIHMVMLRSHYRGKLCRIWDVLAGAAVDAGCCFMLLVGDDVRFLTRDWKTEVEKQFAAVATRRQLPYGTACVAFRDVTFPVFPTFPVIHRSHFRTFGSLLPIQFVNQHGDPFLFELYRRVGAAEFASTASLENIIGGAGDARYTKHDFQWQGGVLTSAVLKLLESLGGGGKAHETQCLNVVVPSYRCDIATLSRITTLTVSGDRTSVHFLVVVDNPAASGELAVLQDWSSNHLVRVQVNASNMGASASRNAGIAASCGDWIVLLDDDIIPEASLLDAYLGAIRRHPAAKIFVGLTLLPAPETLMQHALMASQMTFFYDVARRMKNPPWGVTANLCIQGRTCDRVIWFSDDYPRTGGGEDVDFCLRVKDLLPLHARTTAVVAVPEARVRHPFWGSVPRQIVGWALGDVRCLSALPTKAFYALPNWLEFIFLTAIYMVLCSSFSWLRFFEVALNITLLEVALTGCVSYPLVPRSLPWVWRAVLAAAAAFPIMIQDAARLCSKLLRFKIGHICLQLDWMDGQREHVGATRFVLLVKNAAFLLLATASLYPSILAWITVNGLCLIVGGFVLFWNYSQQFSPAYEMQTLMNCLQPLPVTFPRDHPQPFIILAFQRTGSNLLCGKLHNHVQIVMHNEVFNLAKIWTYQNEDVRSDASWHWNIFSRDADPLSFICHLFTREPSLKKTWRAVGFKLFPDHWTRNNERALQQLLGDARIKKIILSRDNVMDVYISKLRSDKSGHYISKSLDSIRVDVDPAAFAAFIDYYDACYEFYEGCVAGQDVHRVTYEQLVDVHGGDEAVKAVLSFLGVESSAAPPALKVTVKQTARPLSEGIVNYSELEAAFHHHPRMKNILANC